MTMEIIDQIALMGSKNNTTIFPETSQSAVIGLKIGFLDILKR